MAGPDSPSRRSCSGGVACKEESDQITDLGQKCGRERTGGQRHHRGQCGRPVPGTKPLFSRGSHHGERRRGVDWHFSVVLTGTSPKSNSGTKFDVSWSFTPECDTGPCSVQVDILATSCASGSCAQTPPQFDFAGAHSRHQVSRQLFAVKTGCNAYGQYWPYGYEQQTTLILPPASTAKVGIIGTEPIRKVSVLSGTMAIREASTGTRGCNSHAERFNLRGKVR